MKGINQKFGWKAVFWTYLDVWLYDGWSPGKRDGPYQVASCSRTGHHLKAGVSIICTTYNIIINQVGLISTGVNALGWIRPGKFAQEVELIDD